MKKSPFNFVFILLTLCFLSEDSFGYINPSSGYILWQVLFGAIVGCLFFSKRIWFAIRSCFEEDK
jgi:hypothetical protein